MSRTRRKWPLKSKEMDIPPEGKERFERGHISMPLSTGCFPFDVVSPEAKRTYKRLKNKRDRQKNKNIELD